tara:strand:+ start:3046 stop:3939 length:894 start_codon:yes stop_codon:yes gene_type:complete
MKGLKVAVVGLVRGYPQNNRLYIPLIKRNNSIYNNINKLRDNKVDVVLFHEGNISKIDEDYIKSESLESLKFINVSKYFQTNLLKLNEGDKFSLGYRQMCRFNMFHIWNEVADYDYILRADEDVEITKFDPNIFEYMELKNITFLTGRFSKEIHKKTNATLPMYLKDNTELDVDKIYNHKFPYTNLYASKVAFWRKEDVTTLLKKIALSDDQLINRWGDIPVLGGMLNHKQEKINLFPKLEYQHISHDLVIKNNFFRNLTINSKFNPVSINEGITKKIILRIKAKISKNNKYDFRNH